MAVKKNESPPAAYASAMDKLRDEMAKSKDGQLQLLGEGLTVMLQQHPEWEAMLLDKDKTIKGALDAVRKNAKGGCSDPVQTTRSLCAYYGIPCGDARRLAIEVSIGLSGGDVGEGGGTTSSVTAQSAAPPSPEGEGMGKAVEPDPFDLDALLGGA